MPGIPPGIPPVTPPVPVSGNIPNKPWKQAKHHAKRCERCGKYAEIKNGLCPECKWELETGQIPPVNPKEKRSFWSFLKRERH